MQVMLHDRNLIWKCEDRRELKLKHMQTSHLENTLKMLEVNGYVGREVYEQCMYLDIDAIGNDVLSEYKYHPIIDPMQAELEARHKGWVRMEDPATNP